MKRKIVVLLSFPVFYLLIIVACKPMQSADFILTNGKIITVDQNFRVAEAVAIVRDKIIAVGSTNEIRKLAGSQTKVIDLEGKTVIPGLTDEHLHPEMASVSELDVALPDIHTIAELLDWIKSQTLTKQKGEWIILPKMFFTRLLELRQPTLEEVDNVAPNHPVFLDGSYGGMINTEAMKQSGITEKTVHPGIFRDEKTGKLTGLIRSSAFGLLKLPPKKVLSYQEKLNLLQVMLRQYNKIGITSIGSGGSELYSMYQDLNKKDSLTTRVFQNIMFDLHPGITAQMIIDTLKTLNFKTGSGNEWFRIGALKILLDGGILTGTAYLREPWGSKAQKIFGISDTSYQGVIFHTREELLAIVTAANELGWKFTAHSTGGGGVDLLLDVFEEVNRIKPIRERRFSIIHGNFFTENAIKRMSELGVYADVQPAWFYKDADAMLYILGEKRIQTFHPYRSMLDAGIIINGGSDHMVKLDPNTSINPYNPFIAIWTMVTHKTERGTTIVPSEAITREEALKVYTINNAYASFEENIKGSIEPGKLADLAVLTDDILTCPVDDIKKIRSDMTIVGGKIVYSSGVLEKK